MKANHKATTNCANPAIYVGTYKKYNNGNLGGQWIDITTFDSYKELIKYCIQLHKDEVSPELMIQDTQNMPDGLDVMESISESEYNDIIAAWREQNTAEQPQEQSKYTIVDYSEKAVALIGDTKDIKDELKKLGGRFNPRLSCGCGWIFSKKQLDALQALISGDVAQTTTAQTNSRESEYKAMLTELASKTDDKFYKDFWPKYNIGAVKIGDYYYLIEKDTIETKFCWADEGEDYEEYKRITSDDAKLSQYCIAYNLRGIDWLLERLADPSKKYYYTINRGLTIGLYQVEPWQEKQNAEDIKLTDEERKEIIKATEWRKAQFEKRLKAYIKRYGTSKLHTWTYWRDA